MEVTYSSKHYNLLNLKITAVKRFLVANREKSFIALTPGVLCTGSWT